MTTNIRIINDRARFKFLASVAGGEAYVEYLEYQNDLVFLQTYVPDAAHESGLAAQMARAVLDFARTERKKIFPFCALILAYIRLHPEYIDLLDEHFYAKNF